MVLAVWEDAAELDIGPWVAREGIEAPEPTIFHQIGFICSLTASEIVLTSCVGEHAMGVRTRIPAGMIRSLVELAQGEPLAVPKRKRVRK